MKIKKYELFEQKCKKYKKKLSIDLNTKPKKNKISFPSLVFKTNSIYLKKNEIFTNKNINENRKISKVKNNTQENKNNENYTSNKTPVNLTSTSTLIINEPQIITKYIKGIFFDSLNDKKNIKNKQNKTNDNIEDENIISNRRESIDLLRFKIEQNNQEILNINNNKEKPKRCRHKQVKRENYINNKIKDKNDIQINNKKPLHNKCNESFKNSKEENNKSITIPIKKRIKDNIFTDPKKNTNIFDCFLPKNKSNITQIKSLEKYKENKENIEQNNNNKHIVSLKIKVFNKKLARKKSFFQNNTISKYKNIEKTSENKFYKNNSKEQLNQLNKNYKKEKRKEKCNDIYFNENELNESNTKINKVLYFETSTNFLFNQLKINNKDDLNLNKIHSYKNINEKKESYSTATSVINKDEGMNSRENEDIKNIKNIIKNNLDYNKTKKGNIITRKNILKLRKHKTDATLDTSSLQNPIKILNKYDNNNLNIEQNYYTLENNTHSLTINREVVNKRKKIQLINLNSKIKNNKLLGHLFYEVFENKNFAEILFSFCEKDICLLNKISLITKNIYKNLKPIIYTKINTNIKKYNENQKTKNKIKVYLMKNNSSLLKLSPAILRKKYTDLIFENNKYDIEIKKDLTRTFPDNILFKYGNIYYNKLCRVLTAFSNYNKNIGYVQGLNFFAAHIIYFFEDEIDEFTFLDAMIHKFEFDKILDNNLNNQFFKKKLKNINNYLAKQLPKLNNFLSDNKLNLEFFTTNWILTLFSDSMETEFLVIIWDYLIIFGMKFFKYFILNVFILCENDILNSTPNNITYIKKNILRNEKFNNNRDILIKNTIQMMINDENIF